MALMLVALLTLGLAILAAGVAARLGEARREVESLRLGVACDAALAEALAGLAASKGHGGDAAHSFGTLTLESSIEWLSLEERRIVVRASRGETTCETVADSAFEDDVPYVVRWRRLR